MDGAWQFFSEGTATLASSVGYPATQFAQTTGRRDYVDHANRFIRRGGGRFQDLITNDRGTDAYSAALYWRYLYEQCGGMVNGVEDPATGMSVIRRALTVLYSGEIVDVDDSTDLLGATPEILDRALAGSSCPFQTFDGSLVAFARALYGLRVEGGRCVEPGHPAGCGFYDPHALYGEPQVRTLVFNGTAQEHQSPMTSHYDIDLIDIVLAPAAEGKPLTIELDVSPASGIAYHVQVLPLVDAFEAARPQHALVPPAVAAVCVERASKGGLVCAIPEIRTAHYSRLGLIITRLGSKAAEDPTGQYTTVLHPNAK
jgi:hypothetical protein